MDYSKKPLWHNTSLLLYSSLVVAGVGSFLIPFLQSIGVALLLGSFCSALLSLKLSGSTVENLNRDSMGSKEVISLPIRERNYVMLFYTLLVSAWWTCAYYFQLISIWSTTIYFAGLLAIIFYGSWTRAVKEAENGPKDGVLLVFLMLAIVLIAGLPFLPPHIMDFELYYGHFSTTFLRSFDFLRRGFGGYGPEGIPLLGLAVPAWPVLLFSDSFFALRLGSVSIGYLALIGSFKLFQELYSTRIALGLVLFLGTWPPFLHFSRLYSAYMPAIAALVFHLYFLVKGVRNAESRNFVLAGFCAGLGLQSYHSIKTLPFLTLIVLLWWRVNGSTWKNLFTALVLSTWGLVVALGPFLPVLLIEGWSGDAARGEALLWSDGGPSRSLREFYNGDWLRIIWHQITRNFGMFHLYVMEPPAYYPSLFPLFDGIAGAFSIIGIAILFATCRNSSPARLLLVWAMLTIFLFGIATSESPRTQRLLTAFPAFACLPVLGASLLWNHLTFLKKLPNLFIVIMVISNIKFYFLDYQRSFREISRQEVLWGVLLTPRSTPTEYISDLNFSFREFFPFPVYGSLEEIKKEGGRIPQRIFLCDPDAKSHCDIVPERTAIYDQVRMARDGPLRVVIMQAENEG